MIKIRIDEKTIMKTAQELFDKYEIKTEYSDDEGLTISEEPTGMIDINGFSNALFEYQSSIIKMINEMIKDDVKEYRCGCAIDRLTELKEKVKQL